MQDHKPVSDPIKIHVTFNNIEGDPLFEALARMQPRARAEFIRRHAFNSFLASRSANAATPASPQVQQGQLVPAGTLLPQRTMDAVEKAVRLVNAMSEEFTALAKRQASAEHAMHEKFAVFDRQLRAVATVIMEDAVFDTVHTQHKRTDGTRG